MAIIEAILLGERDACKLLSLCHNSILKNKSQEVLKSLEGFYSAQGLFALKQGYQAYKFYQQQISECDTALQEVLQQINRDKKGQEAGKRKAIRHNKPQVNNLSGHMLNLFAGRDATILPGITDYSWLQIYSETGTDLGQWSTEKHFTSWLGLAPGQNKSGKKQGTKQKGRPTAGQIFRKLAQSLLQSKKV